MGEVQMDLQIKTTQSTTQKATVPDLIMYEDGDDALSVIPRPASAL